MYQNLLALHSVDASNQEVITDEDIYAITDTMDSITVEKTAKKRQVQATDSDHASTVMQWPPHKEDFVITLEEDG